MLSEAVNKYVASENESIWKVSAEYYDEVQYR